MRSSWRAIIEGGSEEFTETVIAIRHTASLLLTSTRSSGSRPR